MRAVIAYAAGISTILVLGALCQPLTRDHTRALIPQECPDDPEAMIEIGLYHNGDVWSLGFFSQGAPLCLSALRYEDGEALRSRCLYEEGPSDWVAPVYGPVDDCGAASGG